MPFVAAARDRVRQLDKGDPERAILEFLLKHGVGVHNAKPWRIIERHLEGIGVEMTQVKFQQSILKATREGSIFIGSTDRDGYFLINDRGDVGRVREFYHRRIGKELANLQNLERLEKRQWPDGAR